MMAGIGHLILLPVMAISANSIADGSKLGLGAWVRMIVGALVFVAGFLLVLRSRRR